MARRPASRAPDPRQRTRGAGGGPTARGTNPAGPGPPTLSAPSHPPSPSMQQEDKPHRQVEETAGATGARAVGVRQRRGARGCAQQGKHTDPQTTDHSPVTQIASCSARRPTPCTSAAPQDVGNTGSRETVGEGPNDSPAPSSRKQGGNGVQTSGPEPGPTPPVPLPPPGPATCTAHRRA